RRQFLGAAGLSSTAAALLPLLKPAGASAALEALAGHPGPADAIAQDESFWFTVQQAFDVDRSLINLNNGGVSPTPAIALQAMQAHWEFANRNPSYNEFRIQALHKEEIRRCLAAAFGCDPEEMAITRNTSESMQIVQCGMELRRGDEVLTTTQDYPRMITTWKQRVRRDGIALSQFSIPTPAEDPEEIVALFKQHLTPRTKAILMCHVNTTTGQILPVQRVVRMAREAGVPVIVDGAHSFGHLDFTLPDLDCDYFGTSLHKWLCAPRGTGFLFVRKDRIRGIWPLLAAPEALDDDIRKFEEVGGHPKAPYLAIAEALTFHQGIGPARKAARLRYLRDRWAQPLTESSRVRFYTSLKPEFSCGIAT
ncbi:MAG: hypothetical protein A3K13_07060, partial [Gemmatimonadetes bacterium RIFCSPLOWO2_12_FULL_68_9]